MPAVKKGAVRRSQLVTTYGVGALVPFEEESFMVLGIDRWPDRPGHELNEPRLEQRLEVHSFRQPYASDGSDIPVIRFPRWYSCPKCKRLADHSKLSASKDSNKCARCNRPLITSRFVVVCPNGHIDDFPYMRWVHEGKPAEGLSHELYIDARGKTASLKDVVIRCSCGRTRSMDGSFGKGAFKGIAGCLGRRPWLRADNEECSAGIRTLQRGASNVWFSSVRSAISIPPWSEAAFQILNKHWYVIKAIPENALAGTLEHLGITKHGFSVEELIAVVKERKALESGDGSGPKSEEDFRRQEFDALVRGKPEQRPQQEFVAEPSDVPAHMAEWFSGVMLVKRLREVRALAGFTRLLPRDYGAAVAPLTVDPPEWLPAIEVKGEGIFLRFAEDRVRDWEKRASMVQRAAWLDDQYGAQAERWGHSPDRKITPRLLLAHSFAHALINQLSLDAGYPAASLRERLYVFDDAVGVLIYTATSDSAGSLGGVIAQGAPERLGPAVEEAIERYRWCSNDPVCIETEAAGAEALNLAACHACALLPETSCEHMNTLLDRGVLIGIPEDRSCGFFSAAED